MMTGDEGQIPEWFSGDHIEKMAGRWDYRPDFSGLWTKAVSFRNTHQVMPARDQTLDVRLLGVDLQKDFCLPEGTLFVGGRSGNGAVSDSARIARFIYKNLHIITRIRLTLDTHYLFQIFFAPFWMTRDGEALSEHTLIQLNKNGSSLINTDPAGTILHEGVRPNPLVADWVCEGDYLWLEKQVRFYCEALARSGKYTLYLWPPHCLEGTDGHAIPGVIHEAVIFHDYVRMAKPDIYIKGENKLTENYDPAEVEVRKRWDGKGSMADKRDESFYLDLKAADAYIICGQASSHCVKRMIEGLLKDVMEKEPLLAKKIYILTDCMSAVTVRDPAGKIVADFTDDAEKALTRFEKMGVHLVESTIPLSRWPGLKI